MKWRFRVHKIDCDIQFRSAQPTNSTNTHEHTNTHIEHRERVIIQKNVEAKLNLINVMI